MNVRKYVGQSIDDVIRKVKADLGNDIVLLNVKMVRRRGLLRHFFKDRCEVIAGRGFRTAGDLKSSKPTAPSVRPNPVARPAAHPRAISAYAPAAAAPRPATPESPTPMSLGMLKQDVEELKVLLREIGSRIQRQNVSACPEELKEHYLMLLSNAVSEQLAGRLVGELRRSMSAAEIREPGIVHERIQQIIRKMIDTSDGINFVPGRCVKAAFVGPTGVGKTTTIAKLMAIYANRGKEIGVITTDTQRIAAADQLRRVAELVGVPIRVAATPDDVRSALDAFQTMDLVLIDTAGRGQRNGQKMEELSALLDAATPDEIHLVLDSAKQLDAILDVVEKFNRFRFNNIVLTKVDEAVKLGMLLDILAKVNKKLSFVATGQEIPRDIEIADAGRISRMILREECSVALS